MQPQSSNGENIRPPQDWIKPAQIGIEELISVYVSMGMTPPAALPTIVHHIPREAGNPAPGAGLG